MFTETKPINVIKQEGEKSGGPIFCVDDHASSGTYTWNLGEVKPTNNIICLASDEKEHGLLKNTNAHLSPLLVFLKKDRRKKILKKTLVRARSRSGP